MLQANLSPANPRTMQRHNCMQQALEAAGVRTILKEHATEDEENEVRRRQTVLGSQWPRSSISSPSQRAPQSTRSSIDSWPFISSIM